MTQPGAYERFAIIRIDSNIALNGLNVVAQGSWPDVASHIPDNRFVQQKLRIINDAASAERRLDDKRAKLRAERQAFADSIKADRAKANRKLMQDFVSKLDALTHRIDAIEAQRAYDPDPNERPSPPGYPDSVEPDDGELESPKAAPSETPDLPRSSIEDD